MPRLIIIRLLLLSLGLCSTSLGADRPNILLIVADDLGWTGLSCFGSSYYETPHIDRLAKKGVKFTSAYAAASNCAPSRASMMSGQYTPQHGVLYVGPGTYQDKYLKKHGDLKKFPMLQPHGETELAPSVETLGAALQRGGYRTAMFGKWHLGTGKNHPANRGFDVAIESHGAHFNFKTDPATSSQDGAYLSDFLSDQAAEFIKNPTAKKEDPFFVYYADFLVHKPFEAKEKYLKYFAAKKSTGNHQSPMAAAMIKSLDDSVGKILAAVEEAGETDNTLVIFTSDNGGLSYEEDGRGEANTSNRPLRGRKGSEYDGGLRIPWIVSWPGRSPENQSCDATIAHIDLFPTLLEVSGTKPPAGQTLAGVSLFDLFQNPATQLKSRNLFWYLPGYSAFHTASVMVRRDQWKMIRRIGSEQYLLFDTDQDIGESHDYVSHDAAPASSLGSSLNRAAMDWLETTQARLMIPNPEYEAPTSNRKR